MVQAIINIGGYEDRVLNIIKGKFGLKNKSDAVNFIICKYEEELLEPELKPEYIKKSKRIMKQKKINVGTVENLRKRLNL